MQSVIIDNVPTQLIEFLTNYKEPNDHIKSFIEKMKENNLIHVGAIDNKLLFQIKNTTDLIYIHVFSDDQIVLGAKENIEQIKETTENSIRTLNTSLNNTSVKNIELLSTNYSKYKRNHNNHNNYNNNIEQDNENTNSSNTLFIQYIKERFVDELSKIDGYKFKYYSGNIYKFKVSTYKSIYACKEINIIIEFEENKFNVYVENFYQDNEDENFNNVYREIEQKVKQIVEKI